MSGRCLQDDQVAPQETTTRREEGTSTAAWARVRTSGHVAGRNADFNTVATIAGRVNQLKVEALLCNRRRQGVLVAEDRRIGEH